MLKKEFKMEGKKTEVLHLVPEPLKKTQAWLPVWFTLQETSLTFNISLYYLRNK